MQEDVGDIVFMEHANVNLDNQADGLNFYLNILGFTRDPTRVVGPENMWINIGFGQIHAGTVPGKPQKISGHFGMVVPSIKAVLENIKMYQDRMKDTLFAYSNERVTSKSFAYHFAVQPLISEDGFVEYLKVIGPYGNEFRLYERDPAGLFDPKHRTALKANLDFCYFVDKCNHGSLDGLTYYFTELFSCPVNRAENRLHVRFGPHQEVIFEEIGKEDEKIEWGGYHLGIYVTRWSKLYQIFHDKDLLYKKNRFGDKYDTVEAAVGNHQFRVADYVDKDGKVVHQLELEVRSLVHPLYHRPLVNRIGNVGIKV